MNRIALQPWQNPYLICGDRTAPLMGIVVGELLSVCLCSQCNLPLMPKPVSSKCTTFA